MMLQKMCVKIKNIYNTKCELKRSCKLNSQIDVAIERKVID